MHTRARLLPSAFAAGGPGARVYTDVFLTGCEDGVVRQLDIRERPLTVNTPAVRNAYCDESIVGMCV